MSSVLVVLTSSVLLAGFAKETVAFLGLLTGRMEYIDKHQLQVYVEDAVQQIATKMHEPLFEPLAFMASYFQSGSCDQSLFDGDVHRYQTDLPNLCETG